MISLTPDQRRAIDSDGNIQLSACPGSGKTRVIIAKLLRLAETVEGTPRSIGCITYTNAAVDEIESRTHPPTGSLKDVQEDDLILWERGERVFDGLLRRA